MADSPEQLFVPGASQNEAPELVYISDSSKTVIRVVPYDELWTVQPDAMQQETITLREEES